MSPETETETETITPNTINNNLDDVELAISKPNINHQDVVDIHEAQYEGEKDEEEESDNNDNTHNRDDSDNDNKEVAADERKSILVKRMLKLSVLLLLIGFIVYVIIDSLTTGNVRDGISNFLEWIEDNPIAGFFVFMVVYFAATVLFIPGSILTLGSGFVFANAFGLGPGVLLGSLSVFFGASSGAIVAFLLGRYLFRDWVKQLTKKYAIFEALDVALQEKGFRIMALLRLSPIIPFNAINYIGGVTAISLTSYALALIAILPGTVLYVFLGASAGSLADSASSGDNATVTIVVVSVGCVFGICAVFLTSYYAKKELRRVIEAREAESEAANTSSSDEAAETVTDDIKKAKSNINDEKHIEAPTDALERKSGGQAVEVSVDLA